MLPEKTRDTLEKIRRATKDFSIQNDKADKYVSAVHSKLKKEKPQGLRSEDKKPEPKKVEPKKPAAKKPEPKKPEPKKPEPKKPTKTQTAKVKASLSKLDLAIANDPLLKNIKGTDKVRDAGRKALPKGRRVSKKGVKNQYGTSKGGRVYYENRENRSDRKSPEFKKGYPYLEMGGYTHPKDEGGEFYVKIYTERDGKIVDVQEREYRDKDSAMTFAMMKGNFLNKGQSVFVMDKDGNTQYRKVGTGKKRLFMAEGGEVEDMISDLEGDYMNVYFIGQAKPKTYRISEASISSPKYSTRTLTIVSSNGGESRIDGMSEIKKFLEGRQVVVASGGEEYVAERLSNKMAKGGSLDERMESFQGTMSDDAVKSILDYEYPNNSFSVEYNSVNGTRVYGEKSKLLKAQAKLKDIYKIKTTLGGTNQVGMPYLEVPSQLVYFAKGGSIDSRFKRYATLDINLLQSEGSMAITDTKLGVISGEYENGTFTFRNVKGEKVFSGNKKEAIDFVKNNYQLEQMAKGGEIKGSNPSTGEKFSVVTGSLKKEDGITSLTIRSSYSSRISSYELKFDEKGFLLSIGDFGNSTDGTFPDMGGYQSVKSIDAQNKKESIDAIAKITSPSFAKKVYDYVQEEKMAKGGKVKGFDALSKKVAARYEGKKVPSKFQKEYGKTYDKEEAKEVGDKVAAKVYRLQLAKKGKMAKGGEVKDYEKISDEILKFLESKKGREVKVYNEFPNKYGDNTIDYVVKYNIEDRYNYDKREIKIDFATKRLYIFGGENQGYFPFKTVNDIKKIINKYAFGGDGLYAIYAKGGKLDQGFNDRLDESLGNLNAKEAKMKATFKARRDESKGENKAVGKRPYSTVKTMDKMEKGGKIKLPYNLKKYFTKPKGTIEVKISDLIPNRARKEGIQNAEKYMRQAYDGKIEKRKPITIYKTRNKKYRIKDGNSTFAVAKKQGWDTIFATVEKNPNTTKRAEASVFTIAKQIRKEGEPWKDAVKRAGQMKK